MTLTVRNYQSENDYHQIRAFLREVFIRNDRWEKSWHVNRWDYWTRFINADLDPHRLDEVVFIWENSDGRIAAVLNPENSGLAFLQVHPDFRSEQLDEEMIELAEKYLAVETPDRGRRLNVWTDDEDLLRQDVLKRRGYYLGKAADFHRRRPMLVPVEDTPPAAGYTVRSLGGPEELPARSYLSWRAFHPDEPDEKYQGWQWYRHIQSAPLYRRDLDIVAVAPDGALAAFCTVWYDDATRTGVFEPVGTDPSHQRRGLARAVMTEGLRRLKETGAEFAYVASWGEATHRLYGSLGFTDYIVSRPWVKQLG